MARVPVLRSEADVGAEGATGAEELVQAAGVRLVAEAKEDAEGDPLLDQLTAPDRHRGDANATPDEDRSGGVGVDLLRGGEGVAQRASHPDALPRLQLAETIGPGADSL